MVRARAVLLLCAALALLSSTRVVVVVDAKPTQLVSHLSKAAEMLRAQASVDKMTKMNADAKTPLESGETLVDMPRFDQPLRLSDEAAAMRDLNPLLPSTSTTDELELAAARTLLPPPYAHTKENLALARALLVDPLKERMRSEPLSSLADAFRSGVTTKQFRRMMDVRQKRVGTALSKGMRIVNGKLVDPNSQLAADADKALADKANEHELVYEACFSTRSTPDTCTTLLRLFKRAGAKPATNFDLAKEYARVNVPQPAWEALGPMTDDERASELVKMIDLERKRLALKQAVPRIKRLRKAFDTRAGAYEKLVAKHRKAEAEAAESRKANGPNHVELLETLSTTNRLAAIEMLATLKLEQLELRAQVREVKPLVAELKKANALRKTAEVSLVDPALLRRMLVLPANRLLELEQAFKLAHEKDEALKNARSPAEHSWLLEQYDKRQKQATAKKDESKKAREAAEKRKAAEKAARPFLVKLGERMSNAASTFHSDWIGWSFKAIAKTAGKHHAANEEEAMSKQVHDSLQAKWRKRMATDFAAWMKLRATRRTAAERRENAKKYIGYEADSWAWGVVKGTSYEQCIAPYDFVLVGVLRPVRRDERQSIVERFATIDTAVQMRAAAAKEKKAKAKKRAAKLAAKKSVGRWTEMGVSLELAGEKFFKYVEACVDGVVGGVTNTAKLLYFLAKTVYRAAFKTLLLTWQTGSDYMKILVAKLRGDEKTASLIYTRIGTRNLALFCRALRVFNTLVFAVQNFMIRLGLGLVAWINNLDNAATSAWRWTKKNTEFLTSFVCEVFASAYVFRFFAMVAKALTKGIQAATATSARTLLNLAKSSRGGMREAMRYMRETAQRTMQKRVVPMWKKMRETGSTMLSPSKLRACFHNYRRCIVPVRSTKPLDPDALDAFVVLEASASKQASLAALRRVWASGLRPITAELIETEVENYSFAVDECAEKPDSHSFCHCALWPTAPECSGVFASVEAIRNGKGMVLKSAAERDAFAKALSLASKQGLSVHTVSGSMENIDVGDAMKRLYEHMGISGARPTSLTAYRDYMSAKGQKELLALARREGYRILPDGRVIPPGSKKAIANVGKRSARSGASIGVKGGRLPAGEKKKKKKKQPSTTTTTKTTTTNKTKKPTTTKTSKTSAKPRKVYFYEQYAAHDDIDADGLDLSDRASFAAAAEQHAAARPYDQAQFDEDARFLDEQVARRYGKRFGELANERVDDDHNDDNDDDDDDESMF